MITAIIIDDERKGRHALRQKLNDYCPQVEVLGEAENGNEGLKLIEKHEPSIVFLDIEMPMMNGFEMLGHVPSQKFHLIFTTAYDQYAIKAIKYAAFDYLLKPIDIEELQLTIKKAEEQIALNNTAERLSTLAYNLAGKHQLQKIAIPTMEGLSFFNLSDIIFLKAESNYTTLHFINHTSLMASRTMRDFEELLPTDMFFRTHNSYIINLNYIKRYLKGDGGQIEMQNGDFVDVARRKKEEFIKLIR
ncbi:MAG: LytTR family DNA-binding domain-containing protein [Saprospiraceae bacterium]